MRFFNIRIGVFGLIGANAYKSAHVAFFYYWINVFPDPCVARADEGAATAFFSYFTLLFNAVRLSLGKGLDVNAIGVIVNIKRHKLAWDYELFSAVQLL